MKNEKLNDMKKILLKTLYKRYFGAALTQICLFKGATYKNRLQTSGRRIFLCTGLVAS